MGKCEHIIGIVYHYDATGLVTLDELKEYIEANRYAYDQFWTQNYYTLSDYCDKRKSTDMTRFNYCPKCGEKIDWKAIKRSDNNGK